jgi:hypothetical protein
MLYNTPPCYMLEVLYNTCYITPCSESCKSSQSIGLCHGSTPGPGLTRTDRHGDFKFGHAGPGWGHVDSWYFWQ